MYLTYEEYQIDLCGTLSAEAFGRLEFKARKAVDAATFGRIAAEEPAREPVKRLVFELISLYAAEDATEACPVSSVSADGYSETYAPVSRQELKQKAADLIVTYLSGEVAEDGTPLLYLGVN